MYHLHRGHQCEVLWSIVATPRMTTSLIIHQRTALYSYTVLVVEPSITNCQIAYYTTRTAGRCGDPACRFTNSPIPYGDLRDCIPSTVHGGDSTNLKSDARISSPNPPFPLSYYWRERVHIANSMTHSNTFYADSNKKHCWDSRLEI